MLRVVLCGVDLELRPGDAGADAAVDLRLAFWIEQRGGDAFELVERAAPFDRVRGVAPHTGAERDRGLRRKKVFGAEVELGDIGRLVALHVADAEGRRHE